jgi:hypothetical protein
MSPGLRIASRSAASASAIGLCFTLGVAPPAAADPCTGAAAAVQASGANAVEIPSPSHFAFSRETGHRPTGTNDAAPKPKLGQLPLEILKAFTPPAAKVEKQAAVAPSPTAAAPKPAPAPAPVAAQPPSTAPPGTSLVGWVTGPDGPNQTIPRFAISGTDLGIMWDNGDPANHQVLMAFGDTYGYCGIHGDQWRYNVLLRTQDGALSDTVKVPDAVAANKYSGSPVWGQGLSKQIINSINAAPTEKGIIPTAGIAVGTTQIVNFMSIKSWDANGAWTTNYSGLAVSNDNGESWGVYPRTIRTPRPDGAPGATYAPGNENFQQGAFLKPGPGDPYLYSFGTPAGRSGSAYVARVSPGLVPDVTKYEYWNADSNSWVPSNPAAASVVIPGPVGEMSAQYNTYLKQYLVLYGNGANNVVMRTAPAPQGPWGPEQILVTSAEIPGGIYAPFLHPWSTGRELYYNLSLWSAYNVMLMHTVLP